MVVTLDEAGVFKWGIPDEVQYDIIEDRTFTGINTTYYVPNTGNSVTTATTCNECGAYMSNVWAHKKWHEDLNEVLRLLTKASGVVLE